MRAAQSRYRTRKRPSAREAKYAREEGGIVVSCYTVKRGRGGFRVEGMDECKPFRVGRDTEEDTEYDTPWGRMPVGVVTNDRATGIYLSDGASRV